MTDNFDSAVTEAYGAGDSVYDGYADVEPMSFHEAMEFVKHYTHNAKRLFWDSPNYTGGVDCVWAFHDETVHWIYGGGGLGMSFLEEIKAGNSMVTPADLFATDWVVERDPEGPNDALPF